MKDAHRRSERRSRMHMLTPTSPVFVRGPTLATRTPPSTIASTAVEPKDEEPPLPSSRTTTWSNYRALHPVCGGEGSFIR